MAVGQPLPTTTLREPRLAATSLYVSTRTGMDRSGMEWKQERVETRTERRARPLRTSPSARAVRVAVGPPPPLPHPMQCNDVPRYRRVTARPD